MTDEQIRELGLQGLVKIDPENESIGKWKTWLKNYRFDHEYPDDSYIWLTDVLALVAVNSGNFGIGSVLIDGSGGVVVQGHNELFNPYFRSDRHGEMVVMDKFEDTHRDATKLEGYALYTSLEPCPMCMTRLMTSVVNRVLYAAPDMAGGMVHRMEDLPPCWIELGAGKVFAQGECSQELINAANEIFLLNLDRLFEKLKNR
jgi:cytosine deaminase